MRARGCLLALVVVDIHKVKGKTARAAEQALFVARAGGCRVAGAAGGRDDAREQEGPRPHAEKHTHEHVRGYESGFVEKSPAKRTRANVLSW